MKKKSKKSPEREAAIGALGMINTIAGVVSYGAYGPLAGIVTMGPGLYLLAKDGKTKRKRKKER